MLGQTSAAVDFLSEISVTYSVARFPLIRIYLRSSVAYLPGQFRV
jgi:hypothetical protein